MRAFTRALRVFFVCPWLCCACVEQPGETENQDPKAPGEVLGFYGLSGNLSEDSCGAENMNAPDKWSFQVKLSRDGSAFYWLNGREGIVGEIDKSGKFAFETHLDIPLTQRRGAAKGCTIVRRDSASGSLAESEASVSVKLSYGYEASAGSDCAELVTGTEGLPQALPCRMTYSLSGDRVSNE